MEAQLEGAEARKREAEARCEPLAKEAAELKERVDAMHVQLDTAARALADETRRLDSARARLLVAEEDEKRTVERAAAAETRAVEAKNDEPGFELLVRQLRSELEQHVLQAVAHRRRRHSGVTDRRGAPLRAFFGSLNV